MRDDLDHQMRLAERARGLEAKPESPGGGAQRARQAEHREAKS
ncbi:hypothetical protein [Streptomyces sp. NPDC001205]